MARPVTRARSRIDRVGSSRHPGPEPYRPHWLVPFPGPGAVSVTGHFCAGPLASECLALPLRWAETLPLLRWAQSLWRAGPYYAGPPRLARPVPRARSLDLALRQCKDETCPFTLGAWSLQGFGPLPALIPPDPSRAW